MRVASGVFLVWAVCACASSKPAGKPDEWRARLAQAMTQEVPSRERRDQLSRILVDAVDAGAVEGLSMAELEAAFGRGLACGDNAVCDEHGFSSDAWYYPIGHATDPALKQLPMLIIGFTPHGHVERAFTLKTH